MLNLVLAGLATDRKVLRRLWDVQNKAVDDEDSSIVHPRRIHIVSHLLLMSAETPTTFACCWIFPRCHVSDSVSEFGLSFMLAASSSNLESTIAKPASSQDVVLHV